MTSLAIQFPAQRHRDITMHEILPVVATYYDVTVKSIKGRSRVDNISEARRVCMYLARRLTLWTTQRIADSLGGLNHTSVLYGVTSIERRMLVDDILRDAVKWMEREIKRNTFAVAA